MDDSNMHDYGIYATADELEKIEQLVKESEMVYKETKEHNQVDRMFHVFYPSAPKIYCVVVHCTEEQFSDFTNNKLSEAKRLF